VERAKAFKLNAGTEPDADLGPVISKQVRPHFHILGGGFFCCFGFYEGFGCCECVSPCEFSAVG
jgi:hypothetical protein